MKEIQVVAGIIFDKNNKILIARRKYGLSNAGKWEFPGGKIEENENHKCALIREIKEELNIDIEVNEFFFTSESQLSNKIIILHTYFAKYISGNFILTDHDQIKWIFKSELDESFFSDADINVVKNFKIVN